MSFSLSQLQKKKEREYTRTTYTKKNKTTTDKQIHKQTNKRQTRIHMHNKGKTLFHDKKSQQNQTSPHSLSHPTWRREIDK
jgi:hypothetical protein